MSTPANWSTPTPASHTAGDGSTIAPDWNQLLANVLELRNSIKAQAVTGKAADLEGQVNGHPNAVVNSQSGAAYTLTAADAGKTIEMTGTAAATVTIPADTSAALAVGTVVHVVRAGTGTVTIAGAAGVTLQGPSSTMQAENQFSELRLRKRAANTWAVGGDLLPDASGTASPTGSTTSTLVSDVFAGTSWDLTKWATGGNFTFSVAAGAGRLTSVNSAPWCGKATAQIGAVANVGLVYRFRRDAHNHVMRAYLRATGTLGNYAEGANNFNGLALFYDAGAGLLTLQQFSAGAAATPSGAQNQNRTIAPGTWYWARIEAVSTTVRAKVWTDGTTEPQSWDLSGLTSITSPGNVILTDAMYDSVDGWTLDVDDVTAYSIS